MAIKPIQKSLFGENILHFGEKIHFKRKKCVCFNSKRLVNSFRREAHLAWFLGGREKGKNCSVMNRNDN